MSYTERPKGARRATPEGMKPGGPRQVPALVARQANPLAEKNMYWLPLTVGVANKPKRRKFRRYMKGAVDEALDLGTLAAATLVSDTWDQTVSEKAFITSIDVAWTLDDFTAAADSGPIYIGVAHSDYSDAEIEVFIENLGSWDEGNLVDKEITRRKIKHIGVFRSSPGAGVTGIATLEEGRVIKSKLNWQLTTGDTLKMWAYNKGTAAVGGTAPNLKAVGVAHLWPN